MHGAWQEGRLPLGCHACARSSDGMAMAHGDMLCGRMRSVAGRERHSYARLPNTGAGSTSSGSLCPNDRILMGTDCKRTYSVHMFLWVCAWMYVVMTRRAESPAEL